MTIDPREIGEKRLASVIGSRLIAAGMAGVRSGSAANIPVGARHFRFIPSRGCGCTTDLRPAGKSVICLSSPISKNISVSSRRKSPQ